MNIVIFNKNTLVLILWVWVTTKFRQEQNLQTCFHEFERRVIYLFVIFTMVRRATTDIKISLSEMTASNSSYLRNLY